MSYAGVQAGLGQTDISNPPVDGEGVNTDIRRRSSVELEFSLGGQPPFP
jgi:hypothetical protein